MAHVHGTECHAQRIVEKHTIYQQLPNAEKVLERFGGLNGAENPAIAPSTPASAQLGTAPAGGGVG